jgi:hypothetical protein
VRPIDVGINQHGAVGLDHGESSSRHDHRLALT